MTKKSKKFEGKKTEFCMYFSTNVFHRCLKMRRLSVILTLNTSSAICLLVKDSSLLGKIPKSYQRCGISLLIKQLFEDPIRYSLPVAEKNCNISLKLSCGVQDVSSNLMSSSLACGISGRAANVNGVIPPSSAAKLLSVSAK